jgi:hypothetical protein
MHFAKQFRAIQLERHNGHSRWLSVMTLDSSDQIARCGKFMGASQRWWEVFEPCSCRQRILQRLPVLQNTLNMTPIRWVDWSEQLDG